MKKLDKGGGGAYNENVTNNKKNKMKHLKLFEMKQKHVITTPEYIILYNYFHRDFDKFMAGTTMRKSYMRELYCSGLNKIIKHFKTKK